MKKEDYKIYRSKALEIIALIRSKGYKLDIRYDNNDQDDPQISFRIKGLRWWFAIWAIGEWSEFYMCDIKDHKIAVFAIHDWQMDKFRYSSCDWGIEIDVKANNSELEKQEKIILDWIQDCKKNPKLVYSTISWSVEDKIKSGIPLWKAYFSEWWFYVISNPFANWVRYTGSSLLLWYILKFISYIDPYVIKREIMDDTPRASPRFTFAFLCKENISDHQCYRVWNWYSETPRKLHRWCLRKFKTGYFDAFYNVSDWEQGMSEDEIRRRMFRGIYFKNEEDND